MATGWEEYGMAIGKLILDTLPEANSTPIQLFDDAPIPAIVCSKP